MVEPYLFVVLAVLWLASPALARLPYVTGAAIVLLITVMAGILVIT